MEDMWLWLCSIAGLYRTGLEKLLAYFGTPAEIFQASEKEILAFTMLSQKQRNEILRTRRCWNSEKEKNSLEEKGIRFINCEQSEYPARLREIYDYPYGLFVKGKLPSDDRPAAAVVGARLCSSYGKHWARQTAEELAAAGVQIISGMAIGIDGTAQRAAAEAGGETYAVLGSGVDNCYPGENAGLYKSLPMHGGVLSEYAPGTMPLAMHFPIRNRIISGLSDLVIVIEAKKKSGSLITADMALEQGRDVVAVPGRTDDALSAGCNCLIAQGAEIFVSTEQLKERLGISKGFSGKTKKTNIALETGEKLVYSVLEFQAKNLQCIADETGLAPKEAGAALVRLVLYGMAAETAKNYYAKV